MDAALKKTEYDVLLVGTGMVEAILAGALARVGQKVLHLDQNDYYGSNYASFPLAQFLRWTRNEAAAPRAFGEEGDDSQVASSSTSESICSSPDGATLRALPMESSWACHLLTEGFSDAEAERELLRQSSAFSIDVSPKLLLSSESLVETLISSGVGRYLEFAAIERSYVHLASATTTQVDQEDAVWQVPCSKKDVFRSKLLNMVEKRQLMKFLQFVADYGQTHILHFDVRTQNERSLALGRALQRPQNKVSQAQDPIIAYLDGPFQELLEQHFHLSSKLQQVVVYCVALASFPASEQQLSARDGLAAVFRYVASIGRFTGTAFLAPLYGISELAQSFCRLAAVYGAIYVLRAPVDAFLLDQDTNLLRGVRCSDGDTLRARRVIVNGGYKRSLQLNTTFGQVLRGVFVLRRSLRADVGRFMLVLPPGDEELQNPLAVQVIQLDSGAYACPKGLFLLQVSMTLPREWRGEDERQLELLERVVRRLIGSAEAETRAKTPSDDVKKEEKQQEQQEDRETVEWSQVVAWRAVFCVDQLAATPAVETPKEAEKAELPVNAWVCERESSAAAACALELHLESATAQARDLFEELCPGEPFLPKSASAEQAEQEEQAGEEDAVLRAAQKLAEHASLQEQQSGGDKVGS